MTDPTDSRQRFDLPDLIYLDGNSLGPLPQHLPDRVAQTLAHWQSRLIGGWNDGWMAWPDRLGDRIAPLIGAPAGTVTVGDTLSIRVWQALAAALSLRPGRREILTDTGNFPTDIYMAEGLARLKAQGHRVVAVPPEAVADRLSADTAALLLTEVDYRTGRRHDMAALTAAAHAAGALTVWDLAHSAGAIPVDLTAAGADFAAGCTYKFLNAGPGAPAFIHVAPRHLDVLPDLPGWLGHDAPFAFEPAYRPAAGIARMRIGTPPVIQLAALDAALDLFDGIDMAALYARAAALADRLIAGADRLGLDTVTPRDPARRGSQVSLRHPDAHPICQALIARGVVGDFRAPDILRFGIAPLYLRAQDIDRALDILAEVLDTRAWDRPEHRARAAVT